MKTFKIIIVLNILISAILGCQEQKPIKKFVKIQELTIAQIHDAYKNGDFNSQDLVEAYLKQIEGYDVVLNAISVINTNASKLAGKRLAEMKQAGH